ETFKTLFEKLNLSKDAKIYTDDWDVYDKIIPKEMHVIGKKYTVNIEQNNSNIWHYLGRMTRKTKVVSKSEEMIDITLRISWYLNEADGYSYFQNKALSIY
ncbi:MAG: hypothetical protein A2475_07945, partial [Ignavibacteria bacterium RIFOXYC2_FULL_35_21]